MFRHEDLLKIVPKFRTREVELYLPKFKFECSYGLNSKLKQLGMTDAFIDGKADFSQMTTKDELFISDVIHKTVIEVDEEGTEAAAATAIVCLSFFGIVLLFFAGYG